MFRILLLSTLALCWPSGTYAGTVTLTTNDGTLTVEGELLSFDGEFFRVETAFGPLTLDAGNLRCQGAACPAAEDLIAYAAVAGPTGLVHDLMPPLLELFADQEGLDFRNLFRSDEHLVWELRDPRDDRLLASIDGLVSDQATAQAQLAAGKVDAVLSLIEAKPPVRQDVIALDAVVPLVAAENPRAMVTEAQLSSLLSGGFKTWGPLGGELPVALFTLSGTDALLRRLHKSRITRDATAFEDPDLLSDTVAADPAAMGIGLYSAIGNAVPLVVGGTCGLAIPATRDTIRSEDYPMTQPLFLQRIGARQPKILRDFISFARSNVAQATIAGTGYVDQSIGQIGFERQGDRIANAVLAAGDDAAAARSVREMVGALLNRKRLTLTFRFRDGESTLDAQSSSNIRRLADAINSGEFDGQTLSFVGFSDGVGPADGNRRLSLRRAQSVQRAVAVHVDNAPVTLNVEGYGETLPMACDDTAWGRQVNRRVEVWID